MKYVIDISYDDVMNVIENMINDNRFKWDTSSKYDYFMFDTVAFKVDKHQLFLGCTVIEEVDCLDELSVRISDIEFIIKMICAEFWPRIVEYYDSNTDDFNALQDKYQEWI